MTYSETHYENKAHTRVGGTFEGSGQSFSGVDKSAHPGQWAEIHAQTTPLTYVDPITPQQKLEAQLSATDKDMARVAEDWIAAVAATNPDALAWIKEHRAAGLEKVNARRALREEDPL